ncbi:MAG: RDD family protein [Verrucomicrobiae bacterium]|nr:RDD family protein [Verrucomicrobiae bacterium]
MEFYLLKDGERSGPFKIFHIVEMLRAKQVNETDLGWCSVDDDWKPLKDIPALKGLLSEPADVVDEDKDSVATFPVTNSSVAKMVENANAARPWMRYLARVLDCSVMFHLFALIGAQLGLIPVTIFTLETPSIYAGEGMDLVTSTGLWILATYVWVFIESWLLSTYGTTPGKFLFNLRVVHEDGSLMTYKQALRRSLTVWLRGYGLGIFPLREMLSVMSFIALMQDGKTPWDEQQSLNVAHGGMKPLNWIMLLIAIISLISLKSFVAYRIDPAFREMIDEQMEEATKQAEKVGGTSPAEGGNRML